MYQVKIRSLLRLIWLITFVIVAVFLTARYVMLINFTEPTQLIDKTSDLYRMWYFGIRYDLRVAGICSAPLFLGLFFAIWNRSWFFFKKIALFYIALIAFVITIVAVSNFYYYETYHNYIDMFAFGLVDDETSAVLSSIWQAYPVVKMVIAGTVITIAVLYFSKKLFKKERKELSLLVFVIMIMVNLCCFALFARGSLGTFPLRQGDSQISSLTVLNKLTPNGLLAADWALNAREKDISFKSVTERDGVAFQKQAGLDNLEQSTPLNPWLSKNHPNVVTVMMESFGNNMLAFDHLPNNDLLGSFRPHMQNDFLFSRFVSEGNGTIPSYAAMFFQSPIPTISQSSSQYVQLKDTPFNIYKKAGYKTVFIYSGNLAWRNIGAYLLNQGVDEVYDQNSFINQQPEISKEVTSWGAPDEYAFQMAERLLHNAKQPLFISILTITNHPPYQAPNIIHQNHFR